jgi:hypothetical protein
MLNAPVHRMSKTPKIVSIYAIVSPSDKVYIGQSWNTYDRFASYRRNGCVKQPKLLASLNKHGFNAPKFYILHELPQDVSQLTLDGYEQLYMDSFESGFELLNTRQGGSRGKHSASTRSKISASSKGIKKRKISTKPRKRRELSPEGKAKLCVAVSQYKDGVFVRDWDSILSAATGLNLSPQNIRHCVRGNRPTAGGFQFTLKIQSLW